MIEPYNQNIMDNIFKKFSPNLRQALLMSEKIAMEQKSEIDTEHQLLALILQKGTLANDILQMFDISMDRAQLVAGLVGSKNISKNGINQQAKESIQLAVQIAMRHKHPVIDCEHLLLALISNKKFNSYLIIERMGVSVKNLKNQIQAIFSETDSGKLGSENKEPLIEDINGEIFMDEMSQGGFPLEPAIRTQAKDKKSFLGEFATDITALAKSGQIDPVIGREDEIERMIQTLIRRKKNNPVLIGEPGVGKTAIVEGLALCIVAGKVPPIISDKHIYALDLSSLLAGTMYRGQFETRIKKLLEEIDKKQNAILFIDELHTIIGAGSAEGSLDAANILKPKLARGELRVIGATTLDEYKKHIEKDAAFERRFQPIIVNEPSVEETIEILRGISGEYAKHHGIGYSDEALLAAAKFSARYIQDRFLPDKAIDLIDEAAAAYKLKNRRSSKIAELNLELKNTINQKDEAVAGEDYEKASFLRQKELTLHNKINSLTKHHQESGHQIGEAEIAAVVSKWTGVPLNSLKISEKKMFLNLEQKLKKHIIGQDEAISAIASSIRRSRVGISNPDRPIGSFIFLGPTGVGKTELVKVMANEIYGTPKSLIKIDMSEFMEKHNVSRLIGAPAGYVGYDEGGKLTEQIRRNPYSVILFDEIEKAHPEVFNILLQILEDGELTDAKGRKVNFRNAMIIMTSNLGTSLLNHQASIGFGSTKNNYSLDYQKMSETVRESIEKHFRPEFLNRLDNIIIFKPLDTKIVIKIAELELKKLSERLLEQGIRLSTDKKAVKWIARRGFKPEYGARPMRRVIADYVENPISEKILSGEIDESKKVSLSISNNHIEIIIT